MKLKDSVDEGHIIKIISKTLNFLKFISFFIFGGTESSLLLRLFSSCCKRGLLSSCGARDPRVAVHGLWGTHGAPQ